MAFTELPEAARAAALAEGIVTIHAVIRDYATATGGPTAIARLNQALNGIRSAAQATIETEWPAVLDEGGLSAQWSHVISHAVYVIGAYDFDGMGLTEPQLARAAEIIDLAVDHTASLNAAQGAITALRARQQAHPDDPADPAL